MQTRPRRIPLRTNGLLDGRAKTAASAPHYPGPTSAVAFRERPDAGHTSVASSPSTPTPDFVALKIEGPDNCLCLAHRNNYIQAPPAGFAVLG
jgi:hypothetical protein